ncbi:hypothetical protein [Natrialbaceae archaeon AArc-T1-2]|uniref:hypothetical protein n=1 Tax=Natrialbaceae archaeon AArc-T1-2 TaxID=3053904 RepID=UPI00255ADF77|nr:hypothetical protein [Natrialbaceae archaeon AArc-T1-2]WIV66165.1 hypothetical protein QQ977_10725 [Natrialbaceae archaeon AArc-T1-2]
MTTGPRLRLEGLVPGVLAVALFAITALIVVNTPFGGADAMQGYPDGISITSEIGYAMLDLTTMQSTEGAIADTERFLVAFLLAAIVLDAALDASLVLAKREEEGETVTALSSTSASSESGAGQPATDGGEPTDTRRQDSHDSEGGERA